MRLIALLAGESEGQGERLVAHGIAAVLAGPPAVPRLWQALIGSSAKD